MKQATFEHALKYRPKGYSVRVWEHKVSEAIMNKAWALRTLKTDPDWIKRASDMSIQMLGEFLSKSIITLAKESYDYMKMRAFGESYIGALDPSARRRWEMLSQRRVPPTQYWLYDHRDQTMARTMKFNAKRGYGWVKKSKSELKAGA